MYSTQAKRSYLIEYVKKVLGFFKVKKKIEVRVSVFDFDDCEDMPSVKRDLDILGLNVTRVLGCQFVRLDAWPDAGRIFLNVYLVDDGRDRFPIIQIMDIFLKPKYQMLGIGSSLVRLVAEVATENSVRMIFGVLEKNGDLESRKRFFIRNGFVLITNRSFGLSNICARKIINDEEHASA